MDLGHTFELLVDMFPELSPPTLSNFLEFQVKTPWRHRFLDYMF